MSGTRVDLAGASVLLVGAAGGLGAPLARLLSARGAALTVVGRSTGRLAEVAPPGAVQVTADLREPGAADEVVRRHVEAHGGLDVLMVASGVVAFGPLSELTDAVLLELVEVNLLAPVRLLRAAAPHLAASAHRGGAATAVNISAVVAEQPTAGMAAYSATKAALAAFDAAAGRELRRSGVRLVDARPPHTETGLVTRALAGNPPSLAHGLDPQAVAERIVRAVLDGERDLPASAFGPATAGRP